METTIFKLNLKTMSRKYRPKPKPNIPDLEGEEWMEIYGFPNYLISNMGRVKNIRRGNLVKDHDDGDGYRIIGLFYQGRRSVKRLARLVWNTFNNCDCDLTIDHINRDKEDNRLENLRCITLKEQFENKDNKHDGPKSNKYNLTNEQRAEIAQGLLDGSLTTWKVRGKFGLPMKYTRNVRNRGSWKKYIQDETIQDSSND